MAVVVLWALQRAAPVTIMALQAVAVAQAVGHKHQGAMEELTQAVEAEVALIIILTTKEAMVVRGL